MPFEQSPKRDHRHMRNVLDTIMTVWYKYPELRLGQLLDNARTTSIMRPQIDMFYIEDAKLLTALTLLDDELAKFVKGSEIAK